MTSITTRALLEMKEKGERIVALTCYDALFARLLDACGIDILLVGDSLNQVLAGAPSTLSATLDQMIYHTTMVRRGTERAMVVCDMPFLSYQVSPEDALRNCGRAMKETGCHAVKIEGGQPMAATVRRLVDIGIPVMGHIGLTPQSVHALGGYRVQGREDAAAGRLKADATALQDAGAFAVVLELVPAPLASQITKSLTIPTIGIGAGPAPMPMVGIASALVICDASGAGTSSSTTAKAPASWSAVASAFRRPASASSRPWTR